MFAIVQVGSLQYKVSEGDAIQVNFHVGEPQKNITLDKVLLCFDGTEVKIGQPFLKDVKVTAKVLAHGRGEKSVAFKYRRRKGSSWKKGHRQAMSTLQIAKIAAGK